jgi:CHASE1-domain containing sensor protein
LSNTKKLVAIFEKPAVAVGIFVISLVATFGAWKVTKEASQKHLENRFEIRVKEISRQIRERMFLYEQVLWGTVGFFNASNLVERDEIKVYVDSLSLATRWPGIQGIGYSVPVSADSKAQFIQSLRDEGFPNFTIKPEGERETYTSIIFLEPFDWRNQRAFGFDMWSNDMRRSAMARARDEGVAATSGLITLVQETNRDVQKGFLTYLPHYKKNAILLTVEDRRKAFLGWVYSPFRCNDLMQGILGELESAMLDFQIYDDQKYTEDNLMFSSSPEALGPASPKLDVLDKNLQSPFKVVTGEFIFAQSPTISAKIAVLYPTPYFGEESLSTYSYSTRSLV